MATVPALTGHHPAPPRTLLALATGYVSGYLAAAGDLTRATAAGALAGLLTWLTHR